MASGRPIILYDSQRVDPVVNHISFSVTKFGFEGELREVNRTQTVFRVLYFRYFEESLLITKS